MSALYPKINSIYKRDDRGKFLDEFSCDEFSFLYDVPWLWTEKVDGTNIRIMIDRSADSVTIGGRTDNADIPRFLLDRLDDLIDYDLILDAFPDDGANVILYGEGYGAKIQKGGGNYKADGVDFVGFDVRVGDWWLQRKDVVDVCSKLGLNVVPAVRAGSLREAEEYVATGFASAWGEFPAEGIVATPLVPLFNRKGERIITKLKSRDYRS